jgi:hypothetical protein
MSTREVNNNVDEEDSMCHRKLSMNMTAYLVTRLRFSV